MLLRQPHASAGRVPQVANPVKFSATPVEYRRAPPVLGEHTAEVLRDVLSLGDADLDELRKNKVI